jgi:lysophospholipase L1-like esterase
MAKRTFAIWGVVALLVLAGVGWAAEFGQNVNMRGSLANSRIKFEREKKATVAFMGGSITEMNGYRPMVCEMLRRKFPGTEFTFIDAGISSTCSTTGAFRLAHDVLDKGPVDLFFVEFAVNDDQDAHHTREECVRGMEGIIRHARRANPNMDIVVVHFVNEGMLKTLQEGKTPLTIAAHEAVCERYGVPSINLAREVAGEISGGKLTWKEYGGVHPAPRGNGICAKMIEELLDGAWNGQMGEMKAHPMPEILDGGNYERGRFIDPKSAKIANGWKVEVPEWSKLKGGKRERFTKIPMLCATEVGAEASVEFEGTAVGAYVVAGPDAGIVEASVDGGSFVAVDLYHSFSAGLHYPRTVMFATDLRPGKHEVRIRVGEKSSSGGHAARIMEFVAN